MQNGVICTDGGENQGAASGTDVRKAIDRILNAMWAEGPGGGHYENIISRKYAIVGISLIVNNGLVYLTNDFSGACANR
jgi:hypothetical protein